MTVLEEFEVVARIKVRAASGEAADEFVESCLSHETSVNPALDVQSISRDRVFTGEDINGLVNDAVNDIDSWIGLPDEGARDALNLMVNIVGVRTERPEATIAEVIESNYDASPDEIAGWIGS